MRYLLVCIAICVNIGTVSAGGGLRAESAYIREMPPGQRVTAAFMTVVNSGNQTCVLTGVSSPVAARAEIHGHSHHKGVMRMRRVPALELAPESSLVMAPGGYHVMLFGLKGKISDSEHYPLTLYFEGCPELAVDAEVRSPLR